MPFRMPSLLVSSLLLGSSLLTVRPASAQRVPVADGVTIDVQWPTVQQLGVPLYPDLKAFYGAESPSLSGETSFLFVNFASDADVATLLTWYAENAEGWTVDEDLGMLFPDGATEEQVMMQEVPFINFLSQEELGGSCMGVPCKTTVQILYPPGA